jgi:hypothetical protein
LIDIFIYIVILTQKKNTITTSIPTTILVIEVVIAPHALINKGFPPKFCIAKTQKTTPSHRALRGGGLLLFGGN